MKTRTQHGIVSVSLSVADSSSPRSFRSCINRRGYAPIQNKRPRISRLIEKRWSREIRTAPQWHNNNIVIFSLVLTSRAFIRCEAGVVFTIVIKLLARPKPRHRNKTPARCVLCALEKCTATITNVNTTVFVV